MTEWKQQLWRRLGSADGTVWHRGPRRAAAHEPPAAIGPSVWVWAFSADAFEAMAAADALAARGAFAPNEKICDG